MYHVRIQTYTVYTIAFCPKMIAPIGLFLQMTCELAYKYDPLSNYNLL